MTYARDTMSLETFVVGNPFIGISLSNKHLDVPAAQQYTDLANKYACKEVGILIADMPNLINERIFEKRSLSNALLKTKAKKEDVVDIFSRVNSKKPLSVFTWADITCPEYDVTHTTLQKKYDDNVDFRKDVQFFVSEYLKKRPKTVSDSQRRQLANYILAELPVLMHGFLSGITHYNINLYPTYSSSGMSEFVMDLHRGMYGCIETGFDSKISLIEMHIDG